jgi:hypothetical protein
MDAYTFHRKTNKVAAAGMLILALSWILNTAIAAETTEKGCQWQSMFLQHLGIEPELKTANGQQLHIIKAFVTDPGRLQEFGLYGVKEGDRIKMICLGNDRWRIKHYATGLAIEFSTKPF